MSLFGAGRWSKLIALALVSTAVASAYATGSLSGIIEDPSHAAIQGARLTLINTALPSEFRTTSDAQGSYSFPALPPVITI